MIFSLLITQTVLSRRYDLPSIFRTIVSIRLPFTKYGENVDDFQSRRRRIGRISDVCVADLSAIICDNLQ